MHDRTPQPQHAHTTPGVSIKQLLKNSKAGAAAAQHNAPDRATAHACYVATVKGHADSVLALAFDRDASTLATACEDRVVRLFKCAQLTGTGGQSCRRLPVTALPSGIAFGSDAQQLFVLTNGTQHETLLEQSSL